MSQFSQEAYKAAEAYLAKALADLDEEERTELLASVDYEEHKPQALRDVATKFQGSIDRLALAQDRVTFHQRRDKNRAYRAARLKNQKRARKRARHV